MNSLAQLVGRVSVVAVATLLLHGIASGQCLPVPTGAFNAGDADIGDVFGRAVDIDGLRAVVGAPGDDEKGTNAGAAYVFEWTGARWVEVAKLTAADAALGDGFGQSAAVFGNRIVVGAPGNDASQVDSGAIYVFEYFPPQGWLQAVKLWKGSQNQRMGETVDGDGDLIAVGCGKNSEEAFVYRNIGGIWSEECTGKIAGQNQFPTSVAIDGDTFAYGNAGYDSNYYWDRYYGRIIVCDYDGSGWSTSEVIDGGSQQRYGVALSLDGDHLLSGCGSSPAKMFLRDSSGWQYMATLSSPSYDADVDGDFAVIGNKSTSLPLYQRSGSKWVLVSDNQGSGAVGGDELGASVAVSEGRFIAGAPGSDLAQADAGSVYSFGFITFETYCTAKTTTIPNCLVHMDAVGTPRASDPSTFVLTAGPAPGKRVGIFFWSTYGPAAVPFQMGYLCVQSPITRSNSQVASGTSGVCDGWYRMPLSAIAAKDPNFGAGLNYYVQAWFRDPGNYFDSALSDGLWFVVCN